MRNEDPIQDHYSFLKETIKPKQISKRKILFSVLKMAVLGLVFGAFACVSFFAIMPYIEARFGSEVVPPVIIIQNEGESTDEDGLNNNASQTPSTPIESISDAERPALPLELGLAEYQNLLGELQGLINEAARGTVFVRPLFELEHPLYDREIWASTIAGVIIHQDEQKLLVVVSSEVTFRTERWEITLADNSRHEASLLRQDQNIGLAVLEIDASQLAESTLAAIEAVSVGNSNSVRPGDLVLGIGNFTGHGNESTFGTLTSRSFRDTIPDKRFNILATTMQGNPAASGSLFNASGQLVGLVLPGLGPAGSEQIVSAIAFTDIQAMVETLVNNRSIAHLGIYGITVTEEIAEAEGIPHGVFVTQVVPDSPAMRAGIQIGDILIALNDDIIQSMTAFEREMLTFEAGQEVLIEGLRASHEGYAQLSFPAVLNSQE